MATYIDADDITDLMMKETGFSSRLTAKLTKSDDAVEDLANRKGVAIASVPTDDDTPYLVKEWCIAWVGMEMCFDAMGKNNIPLPEQEKYLVKYNKYRERVKDLDAKITPAILYGNEDAGVADRATRMCGILLRN